MIDWVDQACRSWGFDTRRKHGLSTDPNHHVDGYPELDTIAKARDGLLNVRAAGASSQRFDEFRRGDSLDVQRALVGEPEAGKSPMPFFLSAGVWAHYVPRVPNEKLRFAILSGYLRIDINKSEYWKNLDRAHHFLFGRIPERKAEIC